MPTPPISDATIRRTVAAYNKADGRQQDAAKSLGFSTSTLRGHMKLAKKRGIIGPDEYPRNPSFARPSKNAPSIEVPKLLDSDIPLAELKKRLIRDSQQKLDAHWQRQGYIPVNVKADGPIALAFIGDPHIDDSGCDHKQLYSDVDVIQKNEHIFSVGLGDYNNNWVGRLARLYAEQSVTIKQAWALVKDLIESIRPVALLKGNHNLWSGGTDPLDWMVNGDSTITADWITKLEFHFPNEMRWRMMAAHNFPGRSMWNVLHGPQRKATVTGARAHLYMAGDWHTWGVAQHEDGETSHVYWLGRARGYKVADGYATNLGHSPQRFGHTITAVIDPNDGHPVRYTQCFADVAEAADYLKFKRRKYR